MTRRLAHTPETWAVLAGACLSAGHLWLWGVVYLTPTASLLVTEWTATALIGCVYSTWFLRDTLLDLQAQIRSGRNGTSLDSADVLILTAALLLAVHVMFLALGLPGLVAPRQPAAASVPMRLYGIAYVVIGQILVYGLSVIHRKRARILGAGWRSRRAGSSPTSSGGGPP